MRQKVEYTVDQIKEMEMFYNYCVDSKANFDNYQTLCIQAKLFKNNSNNGHISIQSSVSLLVFSAIVRHRNDILDEIVKRDFDNSKSVRINLPLMKEIKNRRS